MRSFMAKRFAASWKKRGFLRDTSPSKRRSKAPGKEDASLAAFWKKRSDSEDWRALAMLMNKGIALQDAIPIAFSSPETLLAHLQDGAQLLDILPQKGMFYQYLRFFSGLCPLPQAIEMADNLCEIRRSLIRQLRSHLTYPAVLFFIAFVLILFFLHFILPQMQQIVDGASAAGALLVLSVLQASFMLILLALLALFILALLLKRNTELRMLVLMRLRRLPLLRSMISYLFAAFLRELSRQGIATVDALGMLLTLEKGSVLYPCVSEMKRLLESAAGDHALAEAGRPLRRAHPAVCLRGDRPAGIQRLSAAADPARNAESDVKEKKMDRMRHQSGFTILEMMIVLSIVALLFLLTLPNIQQKEAIIEEKGCEALTSVVDAQILLYEIDTLQTPTSVDQLISKGYLKESQKRCPDGRSIVIRGGQAYAQ